METPATGDKAAAAATGGAPASVVRVLLRQLRSLERDPHPAVSVFPSESLLFWRVLVEGPRDTVYSGGTWLGYLKFPEDFPACPPVFKLVTPIRHANINAHGRICHSILDRNWTADTSLKKVFECVYGLLLSPDVADPLDSNLALSFYAASGKYEAEIISFTKLHASRSREEWEAALEATGCTQAARNDLAAQEKAHGNAAHEVGDVSQATRHWLKALAFLGDDEEADGAAAVAAAADEERKPKVKGPSLGAAAAEEISVEDAQQHGAQLRAALLNNLAMLALQCNEPQVAITHATAALSVLAKCAKTATFDPDQSKAKALLRRARARQALGRYRQAEEDLTEARRRSPHDQVIRKEVASVKKLIAKQRKREKKVYEDAFRR